MPFRDLSSGIWGDIGSNWKPLKGIMCAASGSWLQHAPNKRTRKTIRPLLCLWSAPVRFREGSAVALWRECTSPCGNRSVNERVPVRKHKRMAWDLDSAKIHRVSTNRSAIKNWPYYCQELTWILFEFGVRFKGISLGFPLKEKSHETRSTSGESGERALGLLVICGPWDSMISVRVWWVYDVKWHPKWC